MSQILVTGGLGYIGSHTVVELIKAGYEPIVIDNLSESPIEVKDRIEKVVGHEITFRKVEMCNKGEIDAVLKEFPNISGTIHFAAFLLVNESVNDPLKYYHNNILSTVNLLQSMQEYALRTSFSPARVRFMGHQKIHTWTRMHRSNRRKVLMGIRRRWAKRFFVTSVPQVL